MGEGKRSVAEEMGLAYIAFLKDFLSLYHKHRIDMVRLTFEKIA